MKVFKRTIAQLFLIVMTSFVIEPTIAHADEIQQLELKDEVEDVYSRTESNVIDQDEFIRQAENRFAMSTEELSQDQLSSLAMLNYMTVLTQEINASKNSKVFLDDAYSSIVNNINPDVVDQDSYEQIQILLNTIHAYQMIDTKRERIQYIYEQNKAQAFRHAMPNPLALLGVTNSADPLKSLAAVVYMAVNSVDSYKQYATDTEQKYMESGWELDDAASDALHESRKDAFAYMVDMCQDNSIPGKLALNEKAVEDFVTWENNSSIIRRIQFFEKNVETYQAYGKYWIILARSYYENGDYEKCLKAMAAYESMNINTFRKNHEFAEALPFTIVASRYVTENGNMSEEGYREMAEYLTEQILANIELDDWDLRYFAAQTYVDLAGKTGNYDYLYKAFELAEENINYMVDEQRERNIEYLEPIKELVINKTDTKEIQEEKKSYNKWLKEERKVQLPPVSEALVLNCEMLFSIAEEIDLSDVEKEIVDEIIHENNERLFLVDQLDSAYWFEVPKDMYIKSQFTVVRWFTSNDLSFEIPAKYLAQSSELYVSIDYNEKNEKQYYQIDFVDLERNDTGDFERFKATYRVKNFFGLPLSTGDVLTLSIYTNSNISEIGKIELPVTVVVNKKLLGNEIEFRW